jgi:hypothetical protein
MSQIISTPITLRNFIKSFSESDMDKEIEFEIITHNDEIEVNYVTIKSSYCVSGKEGLTFKFNIENNAK